MNFEDYKKIGKKVEYDDVELKKSLMFLTKRHSTKKQLYIFYSLNIIVEKNVHNFFWLLRNYQGELYHNEDEVLSEYYMVLISCIQNFNLKKYSISSFKWYFNTALKRRALRIIEKTYNKTKYTLVEEVFDSAYLSQSVSINLTKIDFNQLNLSPKEKLFLKYKLVGKNVRTIMEFMSLTTSEYYKILENIKIKLNEYRPEKRTD